MLTKLYIIQPYCQNLLHYYLYFILKVKAIASFDIKD